MLIMVTCHYPPARAEEVGKAFIEAMTKYPDDPSIAQPLVRAAVKPTLEGIRVIAISEVKKGKLEEATNLAAKRMLVFAKIEGFQYSMDMAQDAGEAMALLGMEAPR